MSPEQQGSVRSAEPAQRRRERLGDGGDDAVGEGVARVVQRGVAGVGLERGQPEVAHGGRAALERVGRRTPLRPEARELVWALYQRYQELLREDGLSDFDDQLYQVKEGKTSDDEFYLIATSGMRLI